MVCRSLFPHGDQHLTALVAYSLMMAFAFLVIPFAYFYFEEFDLGATTRQRACGALKYTVFTALVMLLFWLLGLFLKPNSGDPSDPEWYRDLLSANGLLFLSAATRIKN